MTDMRDMYQMTRFIYSDKYKPNQAQLTQPHLAIEDAAKQYAQRRHGLLRRKTSEQQALRIIRNAMEPRFGYIEVIGNPSPGHLVRVKTGDGMQLISKRGLVRAGLEEQTMKHWPETRKRYYMKYKARLALAGMLAVAVIGGATTIITAAIKNQE